MSNDDLSTTGRQQRRPVSTPHLVFAIVFLGVAAMKFIGEATNADLPHSAVGFPIVLIGAGIIGLFATLANARRRSYTAVAAPFFEAPPQVDDDTESTLVINEEQS